MMVDSTCAISKTKILQFLECPVCFGTVITPILQCHNGHIICEVCITKIQHCPVCRSEIPKTKRIRNLLVENMIEDVLFDCKNQEKGCHSKLKAAELKDHLLDCHFHESLFCQQMYPDCKCVVTRDGIIEHLKNSHGAVTDGNETAVRLQLNRLKEGHMFWAIYEPHLSSTFVLASENVGENQIWTVFLVGSSIAAKQYKTQINIYLGGGAQKIESNGPVLALREGIEGRTPDLKSGFMLPLAYINAFGNTDSLIQLNIVSRCGKKTAIHELVRLLFQACTISSLSKGLGNRTDRSRPVLFLENRDSSSSSYSNDMQGSLASTSSAESASSDSFPRQLISIALFAPGANERPRSRPQIAIRGRRRRRR